MKSITGLDAAFLYAETPTSPMHIGSVAIVEGSLEFDTFRSLIHSRLHQIPKLRKRLVEVPFGIDYPYWADDPNFDIDMHLTHVALPQPGGWKELRNIASTIFSSPLSQSRPLWSFYFVEGVNNIDQVPNGSTAIIAKVHHVAIDGMAGAGLLSLLFDFTKDTQPIPEPRPYKPDNLPNQMELLVKSGMSFANDPLKFPKLISEALSVSMKSGMFNTAHNAELPTAPFSAPPSLFNQIISSRRKWNTAILSLERVQKLKKIMEVTFNDVILGICAGALRRYLLEKDELPLKPLVAMVPISTRTSKEKDETDNQISSMLIQLATHVEDPIDRLEEIHENTIRGKSYQGAVGAKTLANMAEIVPFGLANQAAKMYSRYKVAELHTPMCNVTITNVPGPQFPLYLQGHKLLDVMGMAPIIDGMGLIITIFSYNGNVTISPTSDVKTMPDIDIFTRYIRESANELEELILKKGKPKRKKTKAKKEKPAVPLSDGLFAHFKEQLKLNAKHIKPKNGVFMFVVTGYDKDIHWKVDINKSPGTVRRSKTKSPDATFTIAEKHLMKIGAGRLNLQTAFIQGRLKISGDSGKAMKLGSILSKIEKYKVTD